MSHALVFVRSAVAFSASGTPTLDRLLDQLSRLAEARITVVARPSAGLTTNYADVPVIESADLTADLALIQSAATATTGPLLLVEGDLVAHDSALNAVVSPDLGATYALTGGRDDRHPALLRQRGRIISLDTGFHEVSAPNGTLRGALKISTDDLPAAAVAVGELIAFDGEHPGALTVGPVAASALALARCGVVVGSRPARMLLAEQVTDEASQAVAEHALSSVNEPETKLRLAIKEQDDLFTTYCVSPFSPHVVKLAARLGFTPTGVTWISILFVGLAAGLFAVGSPIALAGGALLLYAGFLFDCVDGQLARFRQKYSRFGGWLDVIADRGKEYLAYAGLAVGAARHGDDTVWVLALAAMVLQTTRHMVDAWYSALQDEVVAALPRVPLDQPADGLAAARPGGRANEIGAKLGRLSATMEAERRSAVYWLKRTVVFPIGERWMTLALVAAIFGARWSLVTMLVWGGLAFGYVLIGRGLRAHSMRLAVLPRHDQRLHRDDGPLALALSPRGPGLRPVLTATVSALVSAILLLLHGMDLIDLATGWWVALAGMFVVLTATTARHRHAGALDWLTSAGLRATEALFIVLASVHANAPIALTFVLVGLIALFHYDLVGLLDKGASPLRWRSWDLGWEGRAILIGIGALLGIGVWTAVGLLTYLVIIFVGGAFAGLLERPMTVATPVVVMATQAGAPAAESVEITAAFPQPTTESLEATTALPTPRP